MKLASLAHGRDGRLVVVSRDLTRATDAFPVVPTLQAALDDWDRHAPRLADLAEGLEHGSVPSFRFHEHDCAAPLPRAYQWLDGSAYVTKAAWPVMQQQQYGRIVMTSSNSGLYGNFGQSNYAGAKMAVVGLMNALKQEGAKYGILVNTIAPVAATRMTEALLSPKLLPHLKPEYVSQAVAYLCSEACNATGDIISAGAGFYAKMQIMESQGMFFGVDAKVTVDDFAANYAKITDMSKPQHFGSSMEEVAHIAKPFVD